MTMLTATAKSDPQVLLAYSDSKEHRDRRDSKASTGQNRTCH